MLPRGAQAVCAACRRPVGDLCLQSQGDAGALVEVCQGCYFCEEVRRFALRLDAFSEAHEAVLRVLADVFLEVRCLVLEQEEAGLRDASES